MRKTQQFARTTMAGQSPILHNSATFFGALAKGMSYQLGDTRYLVLPTPETHSSPNDQMNAHILLYKNKKKSLKNTLKFLSLKHS